MMTELLSLWLPILVATVGVFLASFVLWAATPWHNADIGRVPDPDAADRALEGLALRPGFYMVPCTHDAKEMKSAAYQERYQRGPWATINVFPGRPNMGRNLGLSFLVALVVSFLIAYLAGSVLPAGAEWSRVFQVATTAGVLAWAFGGMTNGIWFGKPTGWVVRDLIDAGIYALITGASFAFLWPAGAAAFEGVPVP